MFSVENAGSTLSPCERPGLQPGAADDRHVPIREEERRDVASLRGRQEAIDGHLRVGGNRQLEVSHHSPDDMVVNPVRLLQPAAAEYRQAQHHVTAHDHGNVVVRRAHLAAHPDTDPAARQLVQPLLAVDEVLGTPLGHRVEPGLRVERDVGLIQNFGCFSAHYGAFAWFYRGLSVGLA